MLKNHVFGSFNVNNSEKHRLSFEEFFLGTLDTYTKKMNSPSAVLGEGVHVKVCWLIAYYTQVRVGDVNGATLSSNILRLHAQAPAGIIINHTTSVVTSICIYIRKLHRDTVTLRHQSPLFIVKGIAQYAYCHRKYTDMLNVYILYNTCSGHDGLGFYDDVVTQHVVTPHMPINLCYYFSIIVV